MAMAEVTGGRYVQFSRLIAVVGHYAIAKHWAEDWLREGRYVICQRLGDIAGRPFEGFLVVGPLNMDHCDVLDELRRLRVPPFGADYSTWLRARARGQ